LLIQEVGRGTAAATAGLRGYRDVVAIGNQRLGIGGDFITTIDGKAVSEPDAITRIIARKRPGDVVALKIFRDGRTIDVQVKLGEAPEDQF
jgi:S1-C subfamily serine protease